MVDMSVERGVRDVERRRDRLRLATRLDDDDEEPGGFKRVVVVAAAFSLSFA